MKEVKPEVKLVGHPGGWGQNMIFFAARQCYWPGDKAGEHLEELAFSEGGATPTEKERLIRSCIRSGHGSVLEHIQFSFRVKCSRACSHQIVRHRIASFSQQSQRYCQLDDLPVITPDSVAGNRVAHWIFRVLIRFIEVAYHFFIRHGIPAEDARAILPNCTVTELVMTMNARQLRHFFQLRTCNRAQAEIREIAQTMLAECRELIPSVFETAGPKCLELKKCTEAKPCGKAPWKQEG